MIKALNDTLVLHLTCSTFRLASPRDTSGSFSSPWTAVDSGVGDGRIHSSSKIQPGDSGGDRQRNLLPHLRGDYLVYVARRQLKEDQVQEG